MDAGIDVNVFGEAAPQRDATLRAGFSRAGEGGLIGSSMSSTACHPAHAAHH
jgi:hypothetical protein